MKILKSWSDLPEKALYYDEDYDELSCYGISKTIWNKLEGKEVVHISDKNYQVYWKVDNLSTKEHYLTVLEDYVEDKKND